MIRIPKVASGLSLACANRYKSGSHYCLSTGSIHLSIKDNGSYQVEAANNRILAIVKGQDITATSNEAQVLVDGAFWRQIFQGVKEHVHMEIEVDKLKCSQDDRPTVTETHVNDGKFPDTESIIPREPAFHTVTVDPQLLLTALKIVEAFTKGQKETLRCQLSFQSDRNKPFSLTAQNCKGQSLSILIMPLYQKV